MSASRRRRAIVCQQLVEMVNDYLQGDLDPTGRENVEAHLAVCGHCTGYVDQVKRMLALTATLDPEPVPEALLEALTEQFRARRRA
jgi:predicted anti-sigma-YlaC factor YlaD